MIKKPRKFKATYEDAEFISTDIRNFVLEPPSVFDEALNKLRNHLKHPQSEPGLTAIEFILKRIEGDAKNILNKYGYPTNISELVPWLREGEGFVWIDPQSGKTICHETPSIQALSAKQVLSSVKNIRDTISKNDAEETAIETMKLIFAAATADLHDAIMDGVRKAQERRSGGRKQPDKAGYLLAIKEVFEIKGDYISREMVWRYFEKNHNSMDIKNKKSEPMYIGEYEIYFEPDTAGLKKDDVLVQKHYEKKREIKKGTFFSYITQIRPKR